MADVFARGSFTTWIIVGFGLVGTGLAVAVLAGRRRLLWTCIATGALTFLWGWIGLFRGLVQGFHHVSEADPARRLVLVGNPIARGINDIQFALLLCTCIASTLLVAALVRVVVQARRSREAEEAKAIVHSPLDQASEPLDPSIGG